MDVLVLIDKLDDTIHNAKPVPLTDQVRVDKEEVYDILDQMRATIPEEIKQARWIVKERQEMLAEAKRECDRLLGEARELSGDSEGARRAFAHAEKEGKSGDRRTLSLMYSTRKTNAAEALRLAEQERATRGDVYTEDALAWALYRNGRVADAEKAIRRARRYGTHDARLLFHDGAIEKALGHTESGNELLRAALRLNPKFDLAGAAEARALLEEK